MISVGSRNGRKGVELRFGREEMEETELEEGEACYHNEDDDSTIDLDIALSYIDEKVQDVLGHFQKDFEGGVSAENLGAKFGGYGSFLPTYERSPSWKLNRPIQPGDESESSNSIGNSAIVRSNPDLSDEEVSLGLHLGLKAWPVKPEKESKSSSSSVGNYPLPVVKEKPVFSGKLQLSGDKDSDCTDINAFVCILKRRRK